MPLLTPEDHAFFRENGYLVVHEAVPPENLQAVIDALWWFLGMPPDSPEAWYREPLPPGGMVEMYQHQAMWDNRQHPRMHRIFADLLETEKLWASIDRISLKPSRHPDHPEYDHKGFMHWDVDFSQPPVPFWVQGVLYLSDTDVDQGGFQCIPGIHTEMEEWLKTPPQNRPSARSMIEGRQAVPIPGNAGDLVIWDRLLAHGNGHNVSDRPRLAQYVSMYPPRLEADWYAGDAPEEAHTSPREARIRCWQERTAPPGFPGDPRGFEQKYGQTARLTPLGRKLLGLDLWETD
ncbi:MAG: phytanoyl-CoA dioxygenase family protein [Armatimonadetes bacterium]|nr:phytanoyl-CoA dioxygenase family protein [Armatimonadota bacterium]